MSTRYDTRPAYSDYTPRHQRRSGYRTAVITIGSVIAAALVALAAVGLVHHSATPAATSAPASTSAASSSGSSHTPAVVPSASVKKLQQELGQLNYYEGPVDGVMGPQTTAAIQDLQRQAGLPQTGTMNSATQAALDNYLVHGNNQMAG
jgi:murein L,D-transpeptidase YcbB/YkuD